ncbi:MAG: peptidoglycan-associated lipoprotein Pal [Proteobacteria bacterium]|nr:peptidoglycan-associated lipoprotein Pal [Pseudomonadota bacterium]
MTDLSSEEKKLAQEADKSSATDRPAGVDSSGKPILYGDASALGVGDNIIIDVLFDFDRYSIKAESKATLQKNAEILKEHAGAMVTLEGHCDERGTDDYNIALGERRADSVKRYLAKLGISNGRMNIISYGEERPFCNDSNDDCWRQNRRVHFKVGK